MKWAAPVTRGKPRRGSLGVTNKAHLPETARPTTHEHAAARSHFFWSFFRDSTISATRCAREFPIKPAYNGARLWAHVYCVHLMFYSIMKTRPRPASINAERFLRGPRRIVMLNKKKAPANICSDCGVRTPHAVPQSITTLARHDFCMHCSSGNNLKPLKIF